MKCWQILILSILLIPDPARAADTTYGFSKDENGRSYQTKFDLRKRWFWGGAGAFEAGGFGSVLQTGAVYEDFSDWDDQLDRQAFLEGSLQLSTLEFDAMLYRWDRSRRSEEPPVWITTFIGEARRFDVPLHIGPSVVLGRVVRREFKTHTQLRVDIAEAGLHWSFAQSHTLEDFVRIRLAVAGGANVRTGPDEVFGYVAPSASLEARWSPSERGLWQFSFDATARRGIEPVGINWTSLSTTVEVERVLFAVNDQPITLFIQGHGEAFNNVDDRRFQGLVGARINFFVPPPMPPDQCPKEPENYDGFQDEDGCPDPDNDGDGILDRYDQCPNDVGVAASSGCPMEDAAFAPPVTDVSAEVDACAGSENQSECLANKLRCRFDSSLPECEPTQVPETTTPEPDAEVPKIVPCESSPEGCLNED